jgi:hypothetical protein
VIVYALLSYFFLEISGAERREPASGVASRISGALARRRLLPNPGMPDVQAVAFIFGPITGLVIQGFALATVMVVVAILLTVYRRLR